LADAVTAIDEFYSVVTTKPGENRRSKWQNPAVARVSGGVAASEWVADAMARRGLAVHEEQVIGVLVFDLA